MKTILKLLVSIGILIATFNACHHEPAPNTPCTLPDTVSFSYNIQPVFTDYCANAGCHSGDNPEGGLNLEEGKSYKNLMDSRSNYIDTITPKYSLLYAQMVSTSDPMPPTGNLDDCITQLVFKWIEQKAPNN